MLYSIVIPVFRSESNLPALLQQLEEIQNEVIQIPSLDLEVIFVIDGSPDHSYELLRSKINQYRFAFKIVSLSRNFGAFSAVRAGLSASKGDYVATKAADLQEPASLYLDFIRALHIDNQDVAIGRRTGRKDPLLTRILAGIFWGIYRTVIQEEIPPGGADVFACKREVADRILNLREINTSLIGLLFWVGYRRVLIPYQRFERKTGKSSWSIRKKLKYVMDSFFAFSDLPIRLMYAAGGFGILFSVVFSALAIWDKLHHHVDVQGYTATILVISFFGGINLIAAGIIGSYVWRSYENTKGRPDFIVMRTDESEPIPSIKK
jgi:glycosyltransferase involved in cell wall biosynthesis